MEYFGRLLKSYSQLSIDYIENELPMALGWVLVAYALENDGWMQFCGLRRLDKGYIGQEVEKLKQQYFDKHGDKKDK